MHKKVLNNYHKAILESNATLEKSHALAVQAKMIQVSAINELTSELISN